MPKSEREGFLYTCPAVVCHDELKFCGQWLLTFKESTNGCTWFTLACFKDALSNPSIIQTLVTHKFCLLTSLKSPEFLQNQLPCLFRLCCSDRSNVLRSLLWLTLCQHERSSQQLATISLYRFVYPTNERVLQSLVSTFQKQNVVQSRNDSWYWLSRSDFRLRNISLAHWHGLFLHNTIRTYSDDWRHCPSLWSDLFRGLYDPCSPLVYRLQTFSWRQTLFLISLIDDGGHIVFRAKRFSREGWNTIFCQPRYLFQG